MRGVHVILKKSQNDIREETKAEEPKCESSCLVVFLVDKKSAVLMIDDTFEVKGHSD